jgi:hypothetical protein
MSRDRTWWLRLLFGGGAVGCALAAAILYLFFSSLARASALQAAPICATPSRSPTSACLSVLDGQITFEGAVGRGNERITIALQGTKVDARYQCNESPAAACSGPPLRAGSPVVTGWWEGQMVTFGAAETRPSIVTEFNPLDQADRISFFLVLVIPGVSAIVAGLLPLQAPSSVDDLVKSLLASQPDPPREVDVRLLWRVTLGYSTWGGYWLWVGLYLVFYTASGGFPAAPGYSSILLLASGVVAIGLAAAFAPVALYGALRTGQHGTVLVKRFQTMSGRGSTVTKVWYDRSDGREATTTLGEDWTGCVKEGDRLEALADPKTGAVERIVSAPPG